MGKQALSSEEGVTEDLHTQFSGSTKERLVLVGYHRRLQRRELTEKINFQKKRIKTNKDIAEKKIGINSQ